MTDAVFVEIVSVESRDAPPSTLLVYEIRNSSAAPIWVVNDNWLIWNQTGRAIELSFKRGKMTKGSQVYGYFPPAVVRVDPGAGMRTAVSLEWPQSLDRLWNSERAAAPPPGEYAVNVRIGYGTTPEPDRPRLQESVEEPVFRWQKEAVSEQVKMTIPSYPRAAGTTAQPSPRQHSRWPTGKDGCES